MLKYNIYLPNNLCCRRCLASSWFLFIVSICSAVKVYSNKPCNQFKRTPQGNILLWLFYTSAEEVLSPGLSRERCMGRRAGDQNRSLGKKFCKDLQFNVCRFKLHRRRDAFLVRAFSKTSLRTAIVGSDHHVTKWRSQPMDKGQNHAPSQDE